MTQPPILVTGATGNVGRYVVDELLLRNQATFAGVRRPASAQLPAGVTAVRLDLADPATFAPALEGTSRVFLMRPPALAEMSTTLVPFVEACRVAGIEHITFLSLIGVEGNKRVPHYAVEQAILASGIAYTFLRAGFFMQNLTGQFAADIRERREIYCPAGRGKTAFVDTRDIAAVGALSLAAPHQHANRAYDLTGSQALDYSQVAEILSEALGETVTYRSVWPWSYGREMVRRGHPKEFAKVLRMLFWPVRLGMAAEVKPDTAQLLAREPISLHQFALDHVHIWQ